MKLLRATKAKLRREGRSERREDQEGCCYVRHLILIASRGREREREKKKSWNSDGALKAPAAEVSELCMFL